MKKKLGQINGSVMTGLFQGLLAEVFQMKTLLLLITDSHVCFGFMQKT